MLSVSVRTERLDFVKKTKDPDFDDRFGESKDFFALNSFFLKVIWYRGVSGSLKVGGK